MDNDKPCIASSHDVALGTDYTAWLDELGHRFLHARTRAAVKACSETLQQAVGGSDENSNRLLENCRALKT